jgi:hypothetical protein
LPSKNGVAFKPRKGLLSRLSLQFIIAAHILNCEVNPDHSSLSLSLSLSLTHTRFESKHFSCLKAKKTRNSFLLSKKMGLQGGHVVASVYHCCPHSQLRGAPTPQLTYTHTLSILHTPDLKANTSAVRKQKKTRNFFLLSKKMGLKGGHVVASVYHCCPHSQLRGTPTPTKKIRVLELKNSIFFKKIRVLALNNSIFFLVSVHHCCPHSQLRGAPTPTKKIRVLALKKSIFLLVS